MDLEPSAQLRSVAIVGLGLIGGSLARDLAGQGIRVLGWDADADALRAAVAEGVVHHPLPDDLSDVDQADAVVLAVPVLAAADVLRRLKPHLGGVRLITDAGSTKASIVRAAAELGLGDRFVGSHPLAGDHRSGWDASRTGLFDGARVFLCRTPSTGDDAMRLAAVLWAGVGGRPEEMGAEAHDARLAWTSHLPQLVSTALALSLDQSGTPRAELGPGGRDATRLAGSDPDVWTDIVIDNADTLVSALAMMGARLAGLQRAILSGDRDDLRRLFTVARKWHGRDDGSS